MPENDTTIELAVATPERELVHEPVSEIQIPALEGYMGVLPGHAPLVSILGTGALSYTAGGKKTYLAIQGGFVEVLPGRVRVLADIAEPGAGIDLGKARAQLAEAQARLATAEPEAGLAAVALAEARIAAASGG
ncbi:MAG: ATP synthase F1 subunit epsilon [Bryobacteraceae bacterium]|jgi:F-type H+-transporting ATPase subunit epsilon